MPITQGESLKIVKAITVAYCDLDCRHQALVHMLSHVRGAPVEAVESELQAWREEHYEQVWEEAGKRLRQLLRDVEIVIGGQTDLPSIP